MRQPSLVDDARVATAERGGGVLSMSNATGVDTARTKCDLCERPYLFVVSIGGRTGSTTVRRTEVGRWPSAAPAPAFG